jgi:hypothetical protein
MSTEHLRCRTCNPGGTGDVPDSKGTIHRNAFCLRFDHGEEYNS